MHAREEVPAGLAAAALEKRAATMFSGTTGAPVASGESQAASAPTRALCRDAFAVVERLPAALFDKTALHRPCGLLDQYEAVGMLIGDVVGMLLVPAGPIARAVGLKAFKNKEKIAAEVTKVRLAARRKGLDLAAAEAAVLGQAVQLPLPSAAERATAMRAQQPKPPSPAPTPDPTPAEPAPSAELCAPAPDKECVGGLSPSAAVAALCRGAGSHAVGKAIFESSELEWEQMQLDRKPGQDGYDPVRFPDYERNVVECTRNLQAALGVLKTLGLGTCCNDFEMGACKHGTPCECGWTRAPWPWIVYQPGGPFCECHRDTRPECSELCRFREFKFPPASYMWPFAGPHRGGGS